MFSLVYTLRFLDNTRAESGPGRQARTRYEAARPEGCKPDSPLRGGQQSSSAPTAPSKQAVLGIWDALCQARRQPCSWWSPRGRIFRGSGTPRSVHSRSGRRASPRRLLCSRRRRASAGTVRLLLEEPLQDDARLGRQLLVRRAQQVAVHAADAVNLPQRVRRHIDRNRALEQVAPQVLAVHIGQPHAADAAEREREREARAKNMQVDGWWAAQGDGRHVVQRMRPSYSLSLGG